MNISFFRFMLVLLVCFGYKGYSQKNKVDNGPHRGFETTTVSANSLVLDISGTTEIDFLSTGPFTWSILNAGAKEKATEKLKNIELALKAYGAKFVVASMDSGNVKFTASFNSKLDQDEFTTVLKNQGILYTKSGEKITLIK